MKDNKLVKEICKAVADKKAEKISVIDVDGMTVVADAFIVCHGTSKTQVRAICDNAEEEAKKQGTDVYRIDGYDEARWVVLDYGDVLLHVFYEEDREFYSLERLWNNGNNMHIYSE